MRRYDTFTPKAKTAFFYTIEGAEDNGKWHFVCTSTKYSLRCAECPFRGNCRADSGCKQEKTASEWLAWAAEEVNDEKN